MIIVDLHQPEFSLKSSSNCAVILSAQIFYIHSLNMSILSAFVVSPSFFARLSVCRRQKIKLRFQKVFGANGIASII